MTLRHPFYLDSDGVNRPPGPERHPYYGEFAATGSGAVPVVRTVNGEQVPALLVCRHADVRTVLRDQRVFSRAAAAHADDNDVSGTVLGMDGLEHAQVRGVVKDTFAKSAMPLVRAAVEEEAAVRLASMTSRGRAADLVDDFALPFAMNVICDLLGLPGSDRMRFRHWGDAFLGTADVGRDEAARSGREMGEYLLALLRHREAHPAPDLLTRIALAPQSDDVRVKLVLALVIGGWETVAGSIARFVYVLRTRPYAGHETAWDHLVACPEKVDSAVTELERLYSTSTGDAMPRRVMSDVILPSGARLSEGDIVIPSHDAANRDPRVFASPTRMDFDRAPNPHLSYGHGAHFCVGAHLGAMEIRTAIALLLRELPGLRLSVPAREVTWKPGHSVTSPEALPVTW